jgi:predicted Fe-Mo cluster-binding NifX family protein
MNIILTTISPTINSRVDARFGRSTYFLLVDTDTMEARPLPNNGASASRGAGTQAAQFVVKQEVDAVISGDFGPNAYRVLDAAGLPLYLLGTSYTARDAVDRFKAGKLERFVPEKRR